MMDEETFRRMRLFFKAYNAFAERVDDRLELLATPLGPPVVLINLSIEWITEGVKTQTVDLESLVKAVNEWVQVAQQQIELSSTAAAQPTEGTDADDRT